MTPSVEQFVESLVQSGLMSIKDVADFRQSLPPDRLTHTAEDLAKELVRAQRLSKFQATALYQGKTRGLVFGDYIVLDKIGTGGMGKVFKARHRRSGKVAALKVMSSSAMKSERAVRRFQQEARAAARLMHPNIVGTYDGGELNGVHYLLMEYIDGDNLRVEVKTRGPMATAAAIDVLRQVARGLAYAHGEGVIHRDIKPSNLLKGSDGMVKILDMGLARLEDADEEEEGPRLTMEGQMLGTAEYMSPEQVLDPRFANAVSDVYSLGCTAYYILTGTPPFRGNSVPETLIMHQTAPVPSVRDKRPDVSADLDALVRRMLAKQPNQRFQSMEELIAALDLLALGKPVAAPVSEVEEDAPSDLITQSVLSQSVGGLAEPSAMEIMSLSEFGAPHGEEPVYDASSAPTTAYPAAAPASNANLNSIPGMLGPRPVGNTPPLATDKPAPKLSNQTLIIAIAMGSAFLGLIVLVWLMIRNLWS